MSTIVTRSGKGSALSWVEADANFTNLNTDKAEVASPTFTGTPAAPTATTGTNTTQLATTAFVQAKTATQTPFTATGNIAATNVQTAIAEVDTEKVAKAGDTMTGGLTVGGTGLTFPDATVQSSAAYTKTDSDGPLFSAANFSSQSITVSTPTKVTFDDELFDRGNCFDTTLSRFFPTVAGFYQINTTVRFGGTSMTGTAIQIWKNGVAYHQLAAMQNPASTREETLCGATLIYMNGTTDYAEIYGIISGGTSLVFSWVAGGVLRCFFSATFVRNT